MPDMVPFRPRAAARGAVLGLCASILAGGAAFTQDGGVVAFDRPPTEAELDTAFASSLARAEAAAAAPAEPRPGASRYRFAVDDFGASAIEPGSSGGGVPAPSSPPPNEGILLPIEFELDSAQISSLGMGYVESVAGWLSKHPEMALFVDGHTDGVGAASYNQELSERRAGSVRDALIYRGVAPDQLSARGFGSSRYKYPDDPNHAGNRRVEFLPQ